MPNSNLFLIIRREILGMFILEGDKGSQEREVTFQKQGEPK